MVTFVVAILADFAALFIILVRDALLLGATLLLLAVTFAAGLVDDFTQLLMLARTELWPRLTAATGGGADALHLSLISFNSLTAVLHFFRPHGSNALRSTTSERKAKMCSAIQVKDCMSSAFWKSLMSFGRALTSFISFLFNTNPKQAIQCL